MSSFWAAWGCPCSCPLQDPCHCPAPHQHLRLWGCCYLGPWEPSRTGGQAIWGRYGLSAYILLANFLAYVYSLYSSNRQINFTQPFAGYFFLQNTQLPLPSHPLLNQTSLPNPHANATPGNTPANKKQSPPLIFCHVKVQGLEQASPIGSLPGQHLSVQIYSTSS